MKHSKPTDDKRNKLTALTKKMSGQTQTAQGAFTPDPKPAQNKNG